MVNRSFNFDLQFSELLHFIEGNAFTRKWEQLALTDLDLQGLQNEIVKNGTQCPVIPGTGGLRKMRFAPLSWPTGKRGALRIGFTLLPIFNTAFLIAIISKNEQDDLSQQDKKQIKEFIIQAEQELARIIASKKSR